MLRRFACLLVVGLAVSSACGRQGFDEPETVCRGVDCDGHGACVSLNDAPWCVCDPGFHNQDGIGCAADSDPCAGIDCSEHGTCAVAVDGTVLCACDAGYQNDGPTSCVPYAVCTQDIDCDDGLYCNGSETCQEGSCRPGSGDPCRAAGLICDEGSDACTGCGNGVVDEDEHCDPGQPRSDNCCDPRTCTWVAPGSTDPQGVCAPTECQSNACGGASRCAAQNVTAGTQCTDSSPDDCLDAQCDGSGSCDQAYDFEGRTHVCDDGLYCNGVDLCDGSGGCTLHTGDPCQSSAYLETFEAGFSPGDELGDHPDWYDGDDDLGPQVGSGVGCAGSVGLTPGRWIFIWTAHPFDWKAPNFKRVILEMDFESQFDGRFDDDRVGWTIDCESTDTSNVFGVQLDPGPFELGLQIEGYWDIEDEEDYRPEIADLMGSISAQTWYRLRAEISKRSAVSARIDVMLWELDASCEIIEPPVASGSIADTAALGADEPDGKYFTSGAMWPVFKNFSGRQGEVDNARVEFILDSSGVCNEDSDACE
ncbi:MAG: hypothetical protein JXR96_12655 [Deltaproteobacteria bacterium]|nr:hypothetical protein [Deltaproteobacteria bacterium]